MARYVSSKNLTIKSLNKGVMVGGVLELESDIADQLNQKLATIFPGEGLILVPLDAKSEPKRTRKKATKPADTSDE
ncbi:TPA: hypothetical protein TY768_000926 [Streptococcus suis]|nr:hypothetical protein [Streptococcus suis]